MSRQNRLNFHSILSAFALMAIALLGALLVACAEEEPLDAPTPIASSGSEADIPKTEGADPSFIFEQFIQAVNAGNVAGAMSLLTDDVTWEGPQQCEPTACTGKAAAQRNLEAIIATRPNWIRGGGQMQGDFGAFGLLDTSQGGQGSTAGALYLCTVQVKDGKIQSLQMKRQQA
jgi:hypothetical protein